MTVEGRAYIVVMVDDSEFLNKTDILVPWYFV
jgi:hypothetical protein